MKSTLTRKALVEVLLPQQVPDAEVVPNTAFAGFALSPNDSVRLPDLIAHSQEYGALFFIDDGAMDTTRLAELNTWSDAVTCRKVFVSVFHSRKEYAERMDDQAANTFVWFIDEPKHFVFISGSPDTSAQLLSELMAQRATA
ncbi:MAG: hypothetical protein IT230_02850 [Flavobacteriales bacterium]|nr:hypothetical protein [Flavobacteriales bacterium]